MEADTASTSSPQSKIFAYADRFSAAPGEELSFHVSAHDIDRYDAQIVRLRHGHDGSSGPGFREDEVATAIAGSYPGQSFTCAPGSFVEVADPDGRLDDPVGLRIRVVVFPTLPAAALQGILGKWSVDDDRGYALVLDGGRPTLLTGDGAATTSLALRSPLAAHQWYALELRFDADGVRLSQSPMVEALTNRVFGPAGTAQAEELIAAAPAGVAVGGVPFRIGALARWSEGRPVAAAGFNGKIGGPTIHRSAPAREDGVEVVAAWHFGRSPRTDGLLLDDVLDVSGGGLHGRCFGGPVRAVTGSSWKGDEDDFRRCPDEYDAIHFHADDVEDAGWPEAFALSIPDELQSGVYAARLRAGDAEEHVPFFVRPPSRGDRNDVAVLFPTGSYLAYANDHLPFDADGAELLVGHTPILHREDLLLQEHYEFGRSCYEVHDDGSGVVLSSRRRPILTMRPRYRAWFMSEGPWQFPADLCIAHWLETQGLPFDAITDEDLHREGFELLRGYRTVITGSHPEYVSGVELDALERYLTVGGRLMYLGGNGFYWMVSYHPEKPHLMEIRRASRGTRPHRTPAGEYHHATSGERCGLWRNKGRPPQRLTGVGFTAQGFDRSTYYERLEDSFDPRAAFIFEGVGADERIGDFGIMGGGAAGAEVDRFDPELGSPPECLVLATSAPLSDNYLMSSEEILETPPGLGGTEQPTVRSDLTYHQLDGGGAVFSVGSIAWTASLAHNGYANNVATITGNVLRRFASAEPLPGEG